MVFYFVVILHLIYFKASTMHVCYCCIIFFITWLSLSCSPNKARRVLVIHSYEETYAAYSDFDRMIAKKFREEGIKADIRTFYLSCEEYQEQPEIERMRYMLDSLAGWKPEIILVNEDQATYSLLKTYHPMLKEVPVVFAGVNYPNWELLKEYPNVTGFHDKIDFLKNIRMIRKLSHKPLVFTILDATYLDRKIRADFEQQFQGTNTYVCRDSITKEEQRMKMAEGYHIFKTLSVRARQNGAGFLWNLSKFGEYPYLQLKRDFTTINVSRIASTMCFSAINETFGYEGNILGGYMTTLPIQVEEEVGLAARILRGERPEDIPVAESRKVYAVDWWIVRSEGFSKEDIPQDYVIVNMPFRDRYPICTAIIVITSLFVLIAVFAWLIFLYQREARRKRNVLSELEAEREALALAIQGGNTYAWTFHDALLEFESSFWEAVHMSIKKLTIDKVISFIHPDYQRAFTTRIGNFSRVGKHVMELQCDFNGKGYQWWELRYSTIQGANGVLKTAGLLMNIEDFKRRERELIEARELAEKAELKQSFLANMSHEIRTPLNAIVGFSNILTSEGDIEEEDKQQYIDIINTNSELLLKLINDILELSRIESGYMSFKIEKCSVEELINEVYSTHKVLIPSHLEFLKETDAVDAEVEIDRGRLTQVLTNFLNNAGKFTVQGYIKIGFRHIVESHEVYIYVEDTGKGITPTEQKMIFSRFYKQDEFAQGAGLGLSICKVIVEKLNGRIELQSEVGTGSCFTIVLPCL